MNIKIFQAVIKRHTVVIVFYTITPKLSDSLKAVRRVGWCKDNWNKNMEVGKK